MMYDRIQVALLIEKLNYYKNSLEVYLKDLFFKLTFEMQFLLKRNYIGQHRTKEMAHT